MAFFYPFPYTGGVNSDVLTEQLNAVHPAVDGFNTNTAGIITVVATTELDQTTQDALAAVIAAHDPSPTEEQSHQTSGRDALRDLLDNNADLLRYADYFFSRAKLLTAQHLPPRETSLTTLTTATVTLMEGDRATDTDHNAMWRLFLWKLRMKYNIFNTEDELPVLTAAQARNFLTEADSFIEWGRTTCHMLLLRNLI